MIELFLLHLEDREYKMMEGASSLLSSYDIHMPGLNRTFK